MAVQHCYDFYTACPCVPQGVELQPCSCQHLIRVCAWLLLGMLALQELSVWAEVASEEQPHGLDVGLGHKASNIMQTAEGVGLAARRIVAAYKGVTAALDGFESIMKHHQALQVRSRLWSHRQAGHWMWGCPLAGYVHCTWARAVA